jgi:hypothetical protein
MDVVYEQGEWLSEIIAILKIRYAYSSGSMGIEMEYGNINLLQQRLWVPQESIKDLSPTLSKFDDFLVSYENYRIEGGRPRTIISYKMWPTAMQNQAFQGLRGADGTSFRSKGSIDDEALILGYWMYYKLNTVRALSALLDTLKPLVYNGKTPGHIRSSIAAAYEQLEWFETLRSWLHILTATKGHRTLDKYLAAALLKKCGWFSSEEDKNRASTMRKQTDQNYEWAEEIVRTEVYKVEDGSRLVARSTTSTDAVGMGFSVTVKATPSKVRKSHAEKGKKPSTAPRDSTNLHCFRCGEKGHRMSDCPKKKDIFTAEEKAKGKEAQATFNKARADRIARSVDESEPRAETRTQLRAMNAFKAQKILCYEELAIGKVWLEERKGSAIDILKQMKEEECSQGS